MENEIDVSEITREELLLKRERWEVRKVPVDILESWRKLFVLVAEKSDDDYISKWAKYHLRELDILSKED